MKVRTVTNTFVTVKKVDDGESQYLYLLVKVRTFFCSLVRRPYGNLLVAIPIPSGEGQNSSSRVRALYNRYYVAIPIPSGEGQNTYTTTSSGLSIGSVAIPIPSGEGQNLT